MGLRASGVLEVRNETSYEGKPVVSQVMFSKSMHKTSALFALFNRRGRRDAGLDCQQEEGSDPTQLITPAKVP
jgi:hypothetical protein